MKHKPGKDKKVEGEIKKIVVTNNLVYALSRPEDPITISLNKIQRLVGISGILQYRCFDLITKIGAVAQQVVPNMEKTRLELAKKHCKKDSKGNPVMIGEEYEFDSPEKKKLYNHAVLLAIQNRMSPDYPLLADLYAKKDSEGNPIVVNSGINYSFSDKGLEEFEKAFAEIRAEKVELPVAKISIDAATMEKMNRDRPINEQVGILDMMLLQDLFEFLMPK